MAGTSENTGLIDVTIRNVESADQNELIAQLMQRIADMQEELQQTKDLAKLAITANAAPFDSRPPPLLPSLSSPLPDYFHPSGPIASLPAPSSTNLATSNAPYAGTSYQTTLPWYNPSQVPNTNNSQNPEPTTQIAPPLLPKQPTRPFVAFQAPPAYTVSDPYLSIPVQAELNHHEEMEKEWRLKEEKREQEMNAMKETVSQAMKSIQLSKKVVGLEYEDLCMHPDLEVPEGYKIPKFDTFNGIGNPIAHLRDYCNKLVGMGKNDALLMRMFSRSLSGEALEWFTSQDLRQWTTWGALAHDFRERFQFNVEAVPDRYYLEKIKQKTTENFREYAYRWRKEAARVQPVMTESEITTAFIRAQEPEYYERMLPMMGQKFSELVKLGEAIEDGLKSGKVTSLTSLQAASKASPSTGFVKKKREDVSAVSFNPRPRPQRYFGSSSAIGNPNQFLYPSTPQIPVPIYYAQPNYQAVPPTYQSHPAAYQANTPAYHYPRPNNPPRPNDERKPPRVFTPLAETRTQIFERLKAAGLIQPIDAKLINPTSKFFRADQRCAYHSGGAGHDTEGCINLKHKIQDLIDHKVITLQAPTPNVTQNPLPDHEGPTVRMIEREEDWFTCKISNEASVNLLIPAMTSLAVKVPPEFVAMTAPRQTFVLSTERGHDLPKEKFVVQAATAQGMTRSGRCYIPEELTQKIMRNENQKRPITEGEAEEFWKRMQSKEYSIVKHLEKTPAQISIWDLLRSSEYHRQALLKVLNEAHVPTGTSDEKLAAMISRVIGDHQISFGQDELPPEGMMHNQALYITVKCRGKIVARVLIDNGSGLNICPLSTLTQLGYDAEKIRQSCMNVRAFDGEQRKTMGEVDLCIEMGPAEFIAEFQVMNISTSYNLLLGRPWIHAAGAVPSTLHRMLKFIWEDHEVVIHGEGSGCSYPGFSVPVIEASSYGTDFHMVEIANASNEEGPPQAPMPSVYKMIATTMLRSGFEPGVGLGKNSDGMLEPLPIPARNFHFGIGYVPTKEELKEAEVAKKPDRNISKPIPSLYQSFSTKALESEGDDFVEGMGRLFEEEDCATISEEHAMTPTIRDAGPDETLQNWKATPLMVHRMTR